MLGKDRQNATSSASHTIRITCSHILHVQYTDSTSICNCTENLANLVLWWIIHVFQWHQYGASGYCDRAVAAVTVGLVSTKPFTMTLYTCMSQFFCNSSPSPHTCIMIHSEFQLSNYSISLAVVHPRRSVVSWHEYVLFQTVHGIPDLHYICALTFMLCMGSGCSIN